MKTLMTVAALAASLVASSAFAGQDLIQQEQQNRALAAKQAQMQGQAAAGPAGRAGKEGEPGTRQMQLLKEFHPKQAYGPPSGR